MTTNLAKWASNNGQIIKSGLPNDRRAKFLPSVVGFAYDLLRCECYLGNIGLFIFFLSRRFLILKILRATSVSPLRQRNTSVLGPLPRRRKTVYPPIFSTAQVWRARSNLGKHRRGRRPVR